MAHPGGYATPRASAPASLRGLTAAVFATCLTALPLAAQDTPDGGPGGITVDLSFGQSLRQEEGDTALRSDLGLGFASRTRNQSLVIDLDGALELDLAGGRDTRLEAPRLLFNYIIANRNTALEITTRFRRSDIDTLNAIDTLDGTALVSEQGAREDMETALQLDFGRAAPVGATIRLSRATQDYRDTSSTTLIDTTTTTGSVALRFDLSPSATAFARLSASDLDRDSGTDVERTGLETSLELDLRDDLELVLDLGTTRLRQTTGAVRDTQTGLSYGARLSVDRENGALRLTLDSDLFETGRRSTLRLDRQLALPRGQINAGIGISRNSESRSTDPLYALAYEQDLPRARLSASFSQQFSTTTTGAETLESRLILGAQHQLSPLLQLGTALSLRDSNQLSAGGTDSRQWDLSLDLSRPLTEDWDLFGGLRRSLNQQDGQADRTEDTLFFGLRTALEWRP